MLFVLSPAKSLDYDSPIAPELPATTPQFLPQSQTLIELLRQKTPQELASLMSISGKLAALNAARYQDWSLTFTPQNSRQAVLAFNGDVYEGLNAATLSAEDLDWAQEHLLILSGLYGALRPLDLLQAYRLEMGTRLPVGEAENLYAFWRDSIARYLTARLEAQKTPVLVNLASNEYFKAVDAKRLKARVIECVFQDGKNGDYKIISFYAKHARGLMARYAVEQRIEHPDQLKKFDAQGYRFAPGLSSDARLVFRREEAKASSSKA